MVSITAMSTYFKELMFLFFKIFYALIVQYVIIFVFSIGKQPYREAINFVSYTGASPGFGRGGGQEIIFSDLGICMSLRDMLRMAKPCALLGGFGGMLPRENFLKRCNLVRFRVYFDQILSLFFSKNAIFYIKNKYFRYTFVMGYF